MISTQNEDEMFGMSDEECEKSSGILLRLNSDY